jgi:DNA-nicking Smr family endonuclease
MAFRRLTEAEVEIWRKVARTVKARPGSVVPDVPSPVLPEPVPVPRPVTERPAPRSYHAASYTPPVSAPKPPPVGLERRYKRRVADGRVPVEAVLDLHGMTQAQAHVALHRFLVGAQRQGSRLVMVVTGKGARERGRRVDAAEPGVLRRAVPFWLRDGTMRAIVIGFEEAAHGHGGTGALYVRLRRPPGVG